MRIAKTLLPLLFVSTTAWAQVQPAASGGSANSDADSQMETSPAVSKIAYPIGFTPKERSSYFSTGLSVGAGYNGNITAGNASFPTNGVTYSIAPSFTLDYSTGHRHESFSYSPSFLIYQQTSAWDSVNHSATVSMSDRLTQRLSLSVSDNLYRTSNFFNQSYIVSPGGVSGSTPIAAVSVIFPFATQLSNSASGVVSYQYDRDAMIGGGGSWSMLHYSDNAPTQYGYDSFAAGGSAFFNRRISANQYMGVNYQYAHSSTNSAYGPSTVQTHAPFPFYSIYFTKTFSVSITGGAQLVLVSSPQSANAQNSWQPSGAVSLGWQGQRVFLNANAARTTTVATGLFGAFVSTSVGGNAGLKISQTWTGSASISYWNMFNTINQVGFYGNGDTTGIGTSLSHSIRDDLSLGISYYHLHQYYPGIGTLYPNNYSVYGSVSYELRRPLGR